MSLLRHLPAVSFLAALAAFLVLSNVRWIATDPSSYRQGFANYQVSERTGLRTDELELAARQLIGFFTSGEPISLEVKKDGKPAPLFNERETSHLADVRDLFQLAFRAQEIAGVYVVVYLVLICFRMRSSYLRYLGRLLLAGGAAPIGFFILVFVLISLNFDDVFLSFHLISFRNDLWMLDPRTDYLVRMFPQGFWFGATREVVVRSLIAAVALVLIGLGVLRVTPASASGSDGENPVRGKKYFVDPGEKGDKVNLRILEQK
ncbi:MAG: TIGR01906 family membrane protein [Chloroflexi bacterium]|nr:TIGR01906 family membrane protein [Chloroflexota bacterium]